VTAAFPIVLPAEADMGLVKIEQAIVGDHDATAVAARSVKGSPRSTMPECDWFLSNFGNDSFDVDDVTGHDSTSKHGSVE
jgi:hypothetical protein